MPAHHLEGAQVLRYRPGQRYLVHVDYFNLTDYAGTEHYATVRPAGCGGGAGPRPCAGIRVLACGCTPGYKLQYSILDVRWNLEIINL